MTKKICFQVRLEPAQLAALRKLARRRGTSVFALGREAADLVIRKFRRRRK